MQVQEWDWAEPVQVGVAVLGQGRGRGWEVVPSAGAAHPHPGPCSALAQPRTRAPAHPSQWCHHSPLTRGGHFGPKPIASPGGEGVGVSMQLALS